MSGHQSSIFGVCGIQHRLKLAAEPPPALALTEKYRPRLLADLFGQGAAAYQLQSFAEVPYPTAFLFHGDTGTGKTSAALALGNELGVNPDWSLTRIASGTMDAEAAEVALKGLRYAAPGGGWKLVVVDEADLMSPKAKQLWLSILEDLPARSVIAFTTNHLEKFEQRFRDRCEVVRFESAAPLLMQDARALAAKLWRAEGFPGPTLNVATLPSLVENGRLSFRRVVQALQSARHSRPAVSAAADIAFRRRAAALKAAATRRANVAGKAVTRG